MYSLALLCAASNALTAPCPFAQILAEALAHNPHLEVLDLSDNTLKLQGAVGVVKTIKSCLKVGVEAAKQNQKNTKTNTTLCVCVVMCSSWVLDTVVDLMTGGMDSISFFPTG